MGTGARSQEPEDRSHEQHLLLDREWHLQGRRLVGSQIVKLDALPSKTNRLSVDDNRLPRLESRGRARSIDASQRLAQSLTITPNAGIIGLLEQL